jgi:hypothetical protein
MDGWMNEQRKKRKRTRKGKKGPLADDIAI